ncbi:hypothetical protein [Ruegeria atlantica]|uniref:hypothetical protein n=1 Tax=Ruegeria atlantica TaxID=81569 RepID=UPI002493E871|nr:hypothetical protein [Ruegeria atlantica]
MLQPSVHALIEDYEKAQDSVGDWFAELGLKQRGAQEGIARRGASASQRSDIKRQ